jgi:hypothetical protein
MDTKIHHRDTENTEIKDPQITQITQISLESDYDRDTEKRDRALGRSLSDKPFPSLEPKSA